MQLTRYRSFIHQWILVVLPSAVSSIDGSLVCAPFAVISWCASYAASSITVKHRPFNITRPKPVEHGYVFSMAVVTIGGMVETGPFFLLGDVQLMGGGAIFKINILAAKHLIINIMGWVPRKINKYSCIHCRPKKILTRH